MAGRPRRHGGIRGRLVRRPLLEGRGQQPGGVHREDGRMDPAYQRLYFEKYAALDPATTAHVFADLDEPISIADFSTLEEYRDTRIYREWIRPQGIVDAVNTVVDRMATSAGMFIVFRSERDGIVDEETRRRMRLLAPHVRRAAHVARAIERKDAETATYTDAFDGLSSGLFFVDPDGAVLHANTAGRQLLEAGDLLRTRGGRLVASNPGADTAIPGHFPFGARRRRRGRHQGDFDAARYRRRRSAACDARIAPEVR